MVLIGSKHVRFMHVVKFRALVKALALAVFTIIQDQMPVIHDQ